MQVPVHEAHEADQLTTAPQKSQKSRSVSLAPEPDAGNKGSGRPDGSGKILAHKARPPANSAQPQRQGLGPSRQTTARSQMPQGPLQALWGLSAASRLWPGGGQVHQAALLQAWTPAAHRPLLLMAALPATQPSQPWLQRARPAGTWRLLRPLLRRGRLRQLARSRLPRRADSSVGGLGGVGKRPPRQPLPRSWWHNKVNASRL